MAIEKIMDVLIHTTLKPMKTKKGEYVLKGATWPANKFKASEDNYLKLYKKVKKGNMDILELVGKKQTSVYKAFGKEIYKKIVKESYDPATKKITEQSQIEKTLKPVYSKTIEVQGDVIKMSSPIKECFLKPADLPKNIKLNLEANKLTPMAKRVLNILAKK